MARKGKTKTEDAQQVIRQFGWNLAGTLAGGGPKASPGDKAASESPRR